MELVDDQASVGLEAATEGVIGGKENKKESQKSERSTRKVRKKDCVWPEEFSK